ncbi:MAG: preprotein translocase subunit SecE [Legionellaceae bacterium]|nr:preprotein translocase subunit SecE [Legionellaceae bacterium]
MMKDTILWFLTVIVTVLAFYQTYYLDVSSSIHALVWVFWAVAMLPLVFFTTQGRVWFEFAKEAHAELLKVVWPARHETTQTTMIVMIVVAMAGFILWAIDSAMLWAIAKLTHMG